MDNRYIHLAVTLLILNINIIVECVMKEESTEKGFPVRLETHTNLNVDTQNKANVDLGYQENEDTHTPLSLEDDLVQITATKDEVPNP